MQSKKEKMVLISVLISNFFMPKRFRMQKSAPIYTLKREK